MKKLIKNTIIISFVHIMFFIAMIIGVFNTVFPTRTLEFLLIQFFSVQGVMIAYGVLILLAAATALLIKLLEE